MAQQKLLVCLCVFAAAACASAQMNFDFQSCSSAVRYEADRYRATITKSAQSFTASLQETGSQMTDTSVFQQDIDKLTQSVSQMSDLSQGFDMSRFMGMYLENLSTVTSLMRSSMRLSLFSGSMNSYIDFINKMYAANTDFLERVTEKCMPANRRIVLPPSL